MPITKKQQLEDRIFFEIGKKNSINLQVSSVAICPSAQIHGDLNACN